jgi:hypothetical protein
MSAGKTRQNPTKKRSLCVINEHFEEDLNAVLSSAIAFQQPVRKSPSKMVPQLIVIVDIHATVEQVE